MIPFMNSHLSVREATAADAPTLARLNFVVQSLHHDAYPNRFHEPDDVRVEQFYRQLLQPEGDRHGARARSWLCVDIEDEAVGYVLAMLRERPDNPFTKAIRWIELDQVAIVDEARGGGAGRLLVSVVIDWAQDLGVELLELSVWDFNEVARAFFGAMGAQPLWHRQQVNLEAT